jgi:hypothetical protein
MRFLFFKIQKKVIIEISNWDELTYEEVTEDRISKKFSSGGFKEETE